MIQCGIYIIKNIKNNKFYLGSSKEISKRWNRHKNELKNENHHNIFLQRAWIKYGESNFIFEIIKRCANKNLFKYEQELLNKFFNSGLLYNISPTASGGDIISVHPNRYEIIEKITKSINNYMNNLSDEERKEKYSRGTGENNPNYGNNWNEKQKATQSLKKKEYYANDPSSKDCLKYERSEETRKRMSNFAKTRTGNKNPFYGKKHTVESINKISICKKGQYNGNQEKSIIIDNMEYKSLSEASRQLDIPTSTILWRIKSKNIKFEGYKYK